MSNNLRLPRIKRVHNPFRTAKQLIRIGTLQVGVSAEIEDEEGHIWQLLGLLDGTSTVAEVVQQMQQVYPELTADSICAGITSLIEQGFVEDAAALPPPELSPSELARQERSLHYYAWVDTEPRSSPYETLLRLKRSRVTLLGLGGAGSALAASLVAAGIGELHCVDFDVIQVSNLNRQLLYTSADIGRSKVAVAIERLQQLNPQVLVTGQELQIGSCSDLIPLMQQRELFVLCADTPIEQIQRWVNEAALSTRTPWLLCGYAGPMLLCGLYLPYVSPCVSCFERHEAAKWEQQAPAGIERLHDEPPLNAVIAPSANLSGHFGALEAIYYLAGLKPQTIGRIFHWNLMLYDHVYYVEVPRLPDCPACGENSPWRHSMMDPPELDCKV
ncbi:MAG: ThiF family adenylyltransferase [Cyanobacteria bacterium NC_groundwater_1444_Ag_S-0.65um_54_12]|nr:ThiF family adenylyltransferase [Cyanobacteria bacterium NC_groundwater_1444_Ag_S-0.65um_54_12]